MFERFTGQARQAVIQARAEALRRNHDSIGTEHVLIALLERSDPTTAGAAAGDVLAELGVSRADIDAAIRMRPAAERRTQSDQEALATIGIDLDEVRRHAEQAFGPGALERRRARRRFGHLAFEPAAKRALEASLGEALRLRNNSIGTEHLLLGLLAVPSGSAYWLLADRGVSLGEVRAAIARRKAG